MVCAAATESNDMIYLHAGMDALARGAFYGCSDDSKIRDGNLSGILGAGPSVDRASSGDGGSAIRIGCAPFLVVVVVGLRMISAPFLRSLAAFLSVARIFVAPLVNRGMVCLSLLLSNACSVLLAIAGVVGSLLFFVLTSPSFLVLGVLLRIFQAPLFRTRSRGFNNFWIGIHARMSSLLVFGSAYRAGAIDRTTRRNVSLRAWLASEVAREAGRLGVRFRDNIHRAIVGALPVRNNFAVA